MMNFKPGLFQALDDFEPHRPDRIYQHVDFVGLNQKRRVTDPGDTKLTWRKFGKLRRRMGPRSLGEKRGNEDAGEIIAFMPVAPRSQRYSGRSFPGAILRRLANDFSPAFVRKRIRHSRATI